MKKYEIKIDFLKNGAKNAKGLVVIIDVFRACSVLCYVADKNPKEIIISGDTSEVLGLKEKYASAFVIGKNHVGTSTIFNTKNSPSEVVELDFFNRRVIHHSEAGISGLIEAKKAKEVIVGSFVNAAAVARYIRNNSATEVTLVSMGYLGNERSEEDEICAEYIKSLILEESFDLAWVEDFLKMGAGRHFFNEANGLASKGFFYVFGLQQVQFYPPKSKK